MCMNLSINGACSTQPKNANDRSDRAPIEEVLSRNNVICHGDTTSRLQKIEKNNRSQRFQVDDTLMIGRKRAYVQHDYHDHSYDPIFQEEIASSVADMSSPSSSSDVVPTRVNKLRRGPRGGVAEPFPVKLHEMLNSVNVEGFSHIVSWQPHGRCFVIRKPIEFVKEVMPKYFKQSKLTSFQRQVNLYGFSRLTTGKDRGGYYHELFLKGRPDLCRQMIRKRVKGNGTKAAYSPATEPNFYSMNFCLETEGVTTATENSSFSSSLPPVTVSSSFAPSPGTAGFNNTKKIISRPTLAHSKNYQENITKTNYDQSNRENYFIVSGSSSSNSNGSISSSISNSYEFGDNDSDSSGMNNNECTMQKQKQYQSNFPSGGNLSLADMVASITYPDPSTTIPSSSDKSSTLMMATCTMQKQKQYQSDLPRVGNLSLADMVASITYPDPSTTIPSSSDKSPTPMMPAWCIRQDNNNKSKEEDLLLKDSHLPNNHVSESLLPPSSSPSPKPVLTSSSSLSQIFSSSLYMPCTSSTTISTLPRSGDEVFFEGLPFHYLDNLDFDDLEDF